MRCSSFQLCEFAQEQSTESINIALYRSPKLPMQVVDVWFQSRSFSTLIQHYQSGQTYQLSSQYERDLAHLPYGENISRPEMAISMRNDLEGRRNEMN
jgi:hypothetical protein